MSAKYEKLIDLIVNEEQDKARALFHEIVVEQSRKIYESLVAEEDEEKVDEAFGDGESENFVNGLGDDEDHIEGDEEGIAVDDGSEFAGDEMGGEEGGEFGGEEGMGGEGEGGIEDRVMDLESAIDELKAEFDQLMAGEEHEEEEFPGIHGEEGLEGDEFGAEPGADEFGGEESDFDSGEDDGEFEESMVREYVEKVGKDWPNGESEGSPVGGAGKSVSVNKKSIVAGKNDMGGTTKNMNRGGSEAVPTAPKAPSNEYSKGEKKMGQDKYENSPGARAGQAFSQGPKAKTGQAPAVNNKSIVAK